MGFLFGGENKSQVKKLKKIADRVIEREDYYAKLSDEELKNQTNVLKDRLSKGETLDDILPDAFNQCIIEGMEAFGRKIQGFDAPDTLLAGVESRTSSPVRIVRDESMQSVNVRGLYPVGEGAGYAGGIMSAAVDGLKAAERVTLYLSL